MKTSRRYSRSVCQPPFISGDEANTGSNGTYLWFSMGWEWSAMGLGWSGRRREGSHPNPRQATSSLSLSFLICKVGIMTPTSQSCREGGTRWQVKPLAPHAGPGKQRLQKCRVATPGAARLRDCLLTMPEISGLGTIFVTKSGVSAPAPRLPSGWV